MADAFLYIDTPVAIFKARINMASATYPITSLVFDGVTLGAFGDLQADMTLLLGSADGLDDLGRVRVQNIATSTAIPIGRTSEGLQDGELTIVDNAYITVWNDYRVWSKIPYIDDDGIQYKDTTVPVQAYTGSGIPPVANCGAGFADFIDSGNIITVAFDAVNSFAVADGATISTYAWDVDDGTITVGTSASAAITATFPAGFRWVALTVTDSNAVSHTARCPVLAVNPAADVTIRDFDAESSISAVGQRVTFTVKEDIGRATYPDGALMMFWEGAPATAADRSHMKLIGWEQSNDNDARAVRTGNLRGVTLHAVDAAGRLQTLPGFPQSLERHAEPNNWDKMIAPTMDKYIHYLLLWHSTVLAVADYIPSGTGADYPFVIFASEGESLWDQVNNDVKGLIPGFLFTCDIQGRLAVVADPMLLNSAARTATVQASFTETYLTSIRFTYTRPPRVHWLRGHALLTATGYTDVGGVDTLLTVHCIAPGDAPGQGLNEVVTSEGLARSQAALNTAKGHEYARLNSRYGLITVIPPDDDPYLGVQPARATWVNLTVTAATAAQRGLTFATTRTLPKEIRRRWQARRTGAIRNAEFSLEVETSGVSAVTVVPVGTQPSPFAPPAYGDPSIFYGEINPYVLWDGAHVFRTWDLQATSPSWHLIDNGISGNIYDCQYVNVDANTVGAWLMTSTAIWWCADILAFIPVWTSKLPIATVQATDATPVVGSAGFKTMFHYWSAPGHLCVATGPVANDADNRTYAHAYFWVTENYGATWTQVDMTSFLYAGGGFCYSSIYAMNVFRSVPGTIYCVRSSPTFTGNLSEMRVFLSSDLGYTWSQGALVRADLGANQQVSSLLHPFPSVSDPSYAVSGRFGPSLYVGLSRSVDGWTTGTLLTDSGTPTGYTKMANLWRVNSRTFDPEHVMGWFQLTTTGDMHLLESFDRGATWALLWDSALTAQDIPNTGTGDSSGTATSGARHNTPNGWPPDVNQWVIVRAVAASGATAGAVQLTLDGFATAPVDKSGNLNGLLGGNNWQNGPCDGFALPKIGTAASDPPHAQGIKVRVARASANFAASPATISSTGVVEGDVVLLHLRCFENFAPTSVPSGFTLIANGEITGTNSIRIYSKVAGASEPATYDFAFASGNVRVGLAAIYSAESRTLALDASANQSNGSSANWTAPSVTTTQINALLMCFYSSGSGGEESVPQAGMTKGYDTTGANGVHMQHQTRGVSGATGTRTMSVTIQTSRTVTTAWREVI